MSREHPLIAQYMSRFESALRRYGLPDWQGIAADLRSHIAEAESYGKPLASVLEAIGPADPLARAYAVELLLEHPPQNARAKSIGRFIKIAGLVLAGSFISFVVVTVLASFGLSFLLSGVVLLAVGALEAAGVPLAHVSTGGLAPIAIIAMGPIMLALGWGACWLLWRYVRAAAQALRKVLPRGGAMPAA
jgi:uncharacterized membrane protein